jgi:GNAT superfamily N-acetyltransferase
VNTAGGGPPGRVNTRGGATRPDQMSQPPLVTDTAHMAELRAAQAGDIGAIVAIDPHSPGRPSEIQALVREQASLVAVEHGEILGFLAIRPGHFYQRDFIDLLLVAPRSRRQGIGRALMRAALRNASTPRMFVSTNESNTPMRELLRSEGWSPSGALTGLDEDDPEHVFFHDAPTT